MPEFLSRPAAQALGLEAIWRSLETVTPFAQGSRPTPFLPAQRRELEQELARVERAAARAEAHPQATAALLRRLEQCKDVRRSLERALAGHVLDVVELFEIKRFLQLMGELRQHALGELWPGTEDMIPPSPAALLGQLDPAGEELPSFYIDQRFSASLGRIRALKRRLERRLQRERGRLYDQVEAALGQPLGLEGEVVLQRDDPVAERALQLEGLMLERETPSHYFFTVRRNATVHTLEGRWQRLRQGEASREAAVRSRLTQAVVQEAAGLRTAMDCLARLDLLLAKARLGQRWQGVRPRLQASGVRMEAGRHPLVEDSVRRQGRHYTPVSLELGPGVTLLTGPNLGGKTATLEAVGLLVALAQHGLLVPARSFSFAPVDFIFYAPGEGRPRSGLSAFGGEVQAIKSLLERRGEAGLALIDEFARTTNPREGRALARALVAELSQDQLVTLFVTHFDGLDVSPRVQHYQVRGLAGASLELAGEGGIDALYRHMDYQLERLEGPAAIPQHALVVGRLLGLDARLLERARAFLQEGEKGIGAGNH